jgi:hypothetical protein
VLCLLLLLRAPCSLLAVLLLLQLLQLLQLLLSCY